MTVASPRSPAEVRAGSAQTEDESVREDCVQLAPFPEPARLRALVRIAVEALRLSPPLYLQSIFGPLHTWLPPHRELSEYRILDPWRAVRALKWLGAVPEGGPLAYRSRGENQYSGISGRDSLSREAS